jgi:hypothetical protein
LPQIAALDKAEKATFGRQRLQSKPIVEPRCAAHRMLLRRIAVFGVIYTFCEALPLPIAA